MIREGGSVNNGNTSMVHIFITPRNNAVAQRTKGQVLIGRKVSFLKTENFVVFRKGTESIENGQPPGKSPRVGGIKRETTNIIRKDTRNRERKRGKRGGGGRGGRNGTRHKR